MNIESLLERLIASRAFRRAWRAGELALTAAEQAVLATMDPDALEDTALMYCREVVTRGHRGSGSLTERYPRTIAAWRAEHDDPDLDELGARLCESRAFERYRSRGGACLEEAFYRFAEHLDLGDPVTREREFLAAMAVAMAVNPEPAFHTPPEWRVTDTGGFAVTERGPRQLFAVAGAQVIDGPITDLVAELLRADEPARAIAQRHGLTSDQLRAVTGSLAQLGLWSERGHPRGARSSLGGRQ